MFTLPKLLCTALLAALTCLLAGGGQVAGGDKKSTDKKVDDKKKEPPAPSGANFKKSGMLKADDPKDAKLKESPSQKFAVALAEGKTYRIDLTSKDFDAFLRLEGTDKKEVAFNDDVDKSTLDARIIYKAPKAGNYNVVVASFDRKPGKFNLSVVELSDKDAAKAAASEFAAAPIELTLKDGKTSYTGELTVKDAGLKKHFYKVFTVQLEKGIDYRIDLKNAGANPGFDLLLFLEDAHRVRIASDDDSGGDYNARLVFTPKESGTYRLVATTTPIGQTGRFTLEVGPDVPAKKEKKGK